MCIGLLTPKELKSKVKNFKKDARQRSNILFKLKGIVSNVEVTTQQLRQLLYESPECNYCVVPFAKYKHEPRKYITFDHVKALSEGGHSCEDNLIVCCAHCNSLKNSNLGAFLDRIEGMERKREKQLKHLNKVAVSV